MRIDNHAVIKYQIYKDFKATNLYWEHFLNLRARVGLLNASNGLILVYVR